MEKKKPIKKGRIGAVEYAIWEQEGKHGTFHNLSFEHAYRDAETGEYKASPSYGRSPAQALKEVLDIFLMFDALNRKGIEAASEEA